MKNYNLEEIEPLFKECKEFFSNLVRVYKLQGIVIPDSLKSVREKVSKQINNIERKDNDKTNNKRVLWGFKRYN